MSTENGGTDLGRRRVSRRALLRGAISAGSMVTLGRGLSPKAADQFAPKSGVAPLLQLQHNSNPGRHTWLHRDKTWFSTLVPPVVKGSNGCVRNLRSGWEHPPDDG